MSGSKRPLGDRGSKGSIRWDEQNLEENERIKKELNPRKIDEPKTPYLSPMDTDEEGDLGNRMGPLSLDDAAAAAAAAAEGPGPASAGTTSDDAGASGSGRGRGRHVRISGRGWSDSDRTVSPSPRHPDGSSPCKAARSPRFSEQYYDGQDEHEDEEEGKGVDPQQQEKRRRFKEARRQHYNMREQLARAKELLQSADEEEPEDLAAAERLAGGATAAQQQQQQQSHSNGVDRAGSAEGGNLDADVESEQEGAAVARPRDAAALRAALTGHPVPLATASSVMSDD